jgi:N-acetyltransferase
MWRTEPITLKGTHVHLVPLEEAHIDALIDVAADPELWRWTNAVVRTREDLAEYFGEAMRWREQGTALPFATIRASDGKAIGSTRFGNMDEANRRVEIGWTWLGTAYQRTAANTEAKLLMLTHAFEQLNCIRVELKTDELNEKSRRAMERIGAKPEGVLRNHMIAWGGRVRSTIYYSILAEEWPDVKQQLVGMLAAR